MHGAGKEGSMSQFTQADHEFLCVMHVSLEHSDIACAERERRFAVEQAMIAGACAREAGDRARMWRRRCLVACIALGAALFVIEAMCVGRI